jgi:hypothetical protein
MNIEGGDNGLCGTNQLDCSTGGDYVEIYDGRNKNAPVLGHFTGDTTDVALKRDTVTSTGRDMFVRFVTDEGNYGLTGTTSDPGFWAEWSFIADAEDCEEFNKVPGTAIKGHNNEQLHDVDPADCEAACCARQWCKSFDYTARDRHCNLADIDASNQFGTTVQSEPWDLYERTIPATLTQKLGSNGCAAKLAEISQDVNNACCPSGGCANGGVPDTCSSACAEQWLPFSKACSEWLATEMSESPLLQVTKVCEDDEYGRFKAGSGHGRCSDGDLAQWGDEIGPACCGEFNDEYENCKARKPGTSGEDFCEDTTASRFSSQSECEQSTCCQWSAGACWSAIGQQECSEAPGASGFFGGGGDPLYTDLTVPMDVTGNVICVPDCVEVVEEFYAECHPRLEVPPPLPLHSHFCASGQLSSRV